MSRPAPVKHPHIPHADTPRFDLAAALRAHGCYQADDKTEHALRWFQRRNALRVTGKEDAATRAALAA